jgi:hypothetical protein
MEMELSGDWVNVSHFEERNIDTRCPASELPDVLISAVVGEEAIKAAAKKQFCASGLAFCAQETPAALPFCFELLRIHQRQTMSLNSYCGIVETPQRPTLHLIDQTVKNSSVRIVYYVGG